MTLIDDIRSDLINESASLANTLRKAKILASTIGLPEFREWVDSELNGYTNRKSVPEYRKIHPANFGTLISPYNKAIWKNIAIPTFQLSGHTKDFAENYIFFDGVGQLESQASSEAVFRRWPQEMLIVAQYEIEWEGGLKLIDAEQPIPSHAILGVLDSVKNTLLDFLLGLEESEITLDDLKSQSAATERARNIFNITVRGDQNMIATGENTNQTINAVQKGDLNSLQERLRELNVDNSDIDKLVDAVRMEPNVDGNQLGPQVRGWLGGMTERMVSGILNTGVTTTIAVLTKAILDYYGIAISD